MNILFFLGYFNSPLRGGIERVCYNLAEGFKARGNHCFCICTEDDRVDCYDMTCTFIKDESKLQNAQQILKKFVDEYRIDIVILPHPNEYIMLKIVSVLKGIVPIIGHYHNTPVGLHERIKYISTPKLANNRLIKRAIFYINKLRNIKQNRFMITVLDKLVMLSPSYIPELLSLVKCDPNKLTSISNPFIPVTNVCINEKENVILYVGRITEVHKRISSLLSIWSIVSKELINWKFVIVGGGAELDKWKKKAQDLGLQRISFLGYQDPNEYYRIASIFIMTSNYEGFPMTVVESMQYGCVPFAFNTFSAINEMLENGKSGYIIEPYNETKYCQLLINVANNSNLLKEMMRSAIDKAVDYNVDKIVNEWDILCNTLVNNIKFSKNRIN